MAQCFLCKQVRLVWYPCRKSFGLWTDFLNRQALKSTMFRPNYFCSWSRRSLWTLGNKFPKFFGSRKNIWIPCHKVPQSVAKWTIPSMRSARRLPAHVDALRSNYSQDIAPHILSFQTGWTRANKVLFLNHCYEYDTTVLWGLSARIITIVAVVGHQKSSYVVDCLRT